ncbi:MAG: hypothetical protein HRU20_16350 [Pseudomonadales bacterium]|nr:hypothetical protein [Pseudomonadales bacterium]
MKKGKIIWALIIWFLWAAGKDLELLYRHQTTSDYFAYSNSGITPIFFILAVIVLLLNLGALFFLIKPKLIGIKIAFSALIAAAIYNLVTFGLGLSDIEGMKQAYIVSRESRGLIVREEALSMIFSPTSFMVTMAISLAFYILVAFLINKRKEYYQVNA